MVPTRVRMAAPQGDIVFGGGISSGNQLVQQPGRADASFELLAGNDLTMTRTMLQVNASLSAAPSFYDVQSGGVWPGALEALNQGTLSRSDEGSLDRTSRSPLHLVAQAGDMDLQPSIRTARPVRLVAGGDLNLAQTTGDLDIQHQPQRLDGTTPEAVSELSLLKAGRDINLGQARILVGGPGDLVLLAGRDVDLGRGLGVIANGNNDNSVLLPSIGANLSFIAGLRADGADYLQASTQGFAAVGAAALQRRAGDVYALLTATDGSVPALGSAAASAFSALPLADRLSAVKALLGASAYDQALVRYVRGLSGNSGLTDAQALAAFDGLSPVKREAAPGSLLASQLSTVAADRRASFVSQVAAVDAKTTAQALVDFMRTQTGQTLSVADAELAFEQLPLERQLLRLNQVLVDEVRAQGRLAVGATRAADQEAAYDRGYAAINALFPIDRPAGEIRLPSTQARTVQNAGITMLAPGGGVNAGESSASLKPANQLGIVTVAGGDISAIARDDILVNQSRIFTLAQGDILLWSSTGDVDAGRGAKTVVGAPPPVFKLDANGRIVVDTTGSFSGSGIAVLDADSALDLYAPTGAIDAGEAGIRAVGTVVLGAQVVRGADDIKGGSVQGAPPAAPTVGVTAGLVSAAAAVTSAGSSGDDEAQRKKRRARRNLLLEFLGFGRG